MVRASLAAVATLLALLFAVGFAGAQQAAPGVVSNIKVLRAGWPDVSSLEDWKKTYIKDGMKDKDKALAIFNSEVTFQQPDSPPNEFLQREDAVLDPIKLFNVYGYTLCSVSAANMACLARYAGLKARNTTIVAHVVPEFFYDGAWHMLDADLVEYFPKADGKLASVDEVFESVKKWYDENPGYKGDANRDKRMQFMRLPKLFRCS